MRTKFYRHDKYCITFHPEHSHKDQRWGLKFTFNRLPAILRGTREEVETFCDLHYKLRARYDFEHPKYENQLILSNAERAKYDAKFPPKAADIRARRENESLSTWRFNRNMN